MGNKIAVKIFLKRIYSFLSNKYKNFKLAYSYKEKYELVIVDDVFPCLITGFRIIEFSHYINNINNIKVFSTKESFPLVNEFRDQKIVLNEYLSYYPQSQGKITFSETFKFDFKTKFFYCVFINNIYKYFKECERLKIPFGFTLYPGGGMKYNDDEVDRKIKEVCSSDYFKFVIVNQQFLKNYLIERGLCLDSKIELIWGVPCSLNKPNFKLEKFDERKIKVCFFAAKYMDGGFDKGFDVFCEIIQKLNKSNKSLFEFHVGGGFGQSDVSFDFDNVYFHGYVKSTELSSFFVDKHIIISPNRPFVLDKKAFDGFPLGSCVEAMVQGVVLLATDYFNEINGNQFIDGDDLFKIDTNADSICNIVLNLESNREEIKRISLNSTNKVSFLYSEKEQLGRRLELIKKYL